MNYLQYTTGRIQQASMQTIIEERAFKKFSFFTPDSRPAFLDGAVPPPNSGSENVRG